jgi:hypothetical protein
VTPIGRPPQTKAMASELTGVMAETQLDVADLNCKSYRLWGMMIPAA